MQAKFITFEGSEGCGKSTQSKLLAGYLKRKGHRVVYLREPGSASISEKIRKVLLNPENKISPVCEMLLYMAARAQLVEEVIQPALERGAIVICDRFLDSTVAYQGYGLGMDIKSIKAVGKVATLGVKPDLTFFMDLSVKDGLVHRRQKDRIESRSFSYHQRVRDGYLRLAAQEPRRIKVVKVEKEKLVTQQKIRKLTLNSIH
ncbi:MAG: dTMP kinase [Candidatus Omnitrophica bacterium]|nr:dTMP kinase [Candidatus Omnitrophota bacterium]